MLKNDGRQSTSKASKKKHKSRRVKCSCGEMCIYSEGDIIHISGLKYVTCEFCQKEIILK